MKRWLHNWLILLLVGGLGTLLCFPINLHDHCTCLADHLITIYWQGQSVGQASATAMETFSPLTEISPLLKRYLIPYGLLWWTSLGILFWGAVLYDRGKRARVELSVKQ